MPTRPPRLKETPSQTAGPYVHIGLTPSLEGVGGSNTPDLGAGSLATVAGPRIVLTGRISDGAGGPVTDAIVEIWQADPQGIYAAPGFAGWGRQATNGAGEYRFETVKPGRVPGPDGKPMAPHATLYIVARGINVGLHTRLYFPDEAAANDADYLLSRIAEPARRATLIASRSEDRGLDVYRLDIRLQGEGETVFLDI